MEGRIARLESQLDAINKDVTELKTGQATLIERTLHLATKEDLAKTATTVGGIVIAFLTVVTIAARFLLPAP